MRLFVPGVGMSVAIEINHLNYRYSNRTVGLSDVTFSVASGQRVAIIGPNGAGKSTLLSHLNGLLPEMHVKHGHSIKIFGEEIGPKNLRKIRQRVGFVFQDSQDQLFCSTVYDDVAFGPGQFGWSKEEVARKVKDVLARLGIQDLERRSPHELSGGQRRRVCLAGVLVCEPDILVLDEPTSDLDPRGRRELKEILRELLITQIIATHDLDLVYELCDRALLLDGGRLIMEGTPRDLLSNESLMLSHGLETPRWLQP